MTVYHKPAITAPEASTSALSESSQEADYPVIQGVDPGEEARPTVAVIEPVAPSGSKAAVKPAADKQKQKKAEKPPEKKGKKKHGHSKKIGTVVSAEKNKKFNPKVKVRGWLDEWEPEPEPEG